MTITEYDLGQWSVIEKLITNGYEDEAHDMVCATLHSSAWCDAVASESKYTANHEEEIDEFVQEHRARFE